MRNKNKKSLRRKIVLLLPDLDRAKNSVLNSLSSPNSRRNYRFRNGAVHHLVLFRATAGFVSNAVGDLLHGLRTADRKVW
jgi:hypothetical protein